MGASAWGGEVYPLYAIQVWRVGNTLSQIAFGHLKTKAPARAPALGEQLLLVMCDRSLAHQQCFVADSVWRHQITSSRAGAGRSRGLLYDRGGLHGFTVQVKPWALSPPAVVERSFFLYTPNKSRRIKGHTHIYTQGVTILRIL